MERERDVERCRERERDVERERERDVERERERGVRARQRERDEGSSVCWSSSGVGGV